MPARCPVIGGEHPVPSHCGQARRNQASPQGDVRQVRLAPIRSFVCADRHGWTVSAGTHLVAGAPVSRAQGKSPRELAEPAEIKDVDVPPTEGDGSFPSNPLQHTIHSRASRTRHDGKVLLGEV